MIKEVILPDGNLFKGNYENNVRNGKGIKTYSNGATFEGYWVNDKRHGKGVKTWADGTKVDVEYVNGILVDPE